MSYVKNYLETNLNTQVHFADGQGERFSLSAARNNAVSQAKDMEAEVVVICDADTILEKDSIIDAILHVKSFNSIVIPYKISRYLTENSSNAVLRRNSNPNDLEAIASFDWSVGGAVVTSVDEWERVGGQDERFTGWGCEDVAFMIAAEKMGNRPIKIDGVMNHLWHPSAEKSGEAYEYNAMLLQRYADTDNVELLIEEGKKGIR
jgi:predicted glycosyltransferase involved in capsule biosynthesis